MIEKQYKESVTLWREPTGIGNSTKSQSHCGGGLL